MPPLKIQTIVTDMEGNTLSENVIYVDVQTTLTYRNFEMPKPPKTTPPSPAEIGQRRSANIEARKNKAKSVVADVVEDIEARNKKIMSMFKRGKTRSEIGEKFGISYQTVYGITKKYLGAEEAR